jgi:hypothetical protein
VSFFLSRFAKSRPSLPLSRVLSSIRMAGLFVCRMWSSPYCGLSPRLLTASVSVSPVGRPRVPVASVPITASGPHTAVRRRLGGWVRTCPYPVPLSSASRPRVVRGVDGAVPLYVKAESRSRYATPDRFRGEPRSPRRLCRPKGRRPGGGPHVRPTARVRARPRRPEAQPGRRQSSAELVRVVRPVPVRPPREFASPLSVCACWLVILPSAVY